VARPGRYGAQTPPSVIDALNLAGGALTSGDMNRISVLRRNGPGPHQFTVDVGSALRNGTEASLPALMAGDMILVPTAVSLVGGGGNEDAVGVLGEVNRPGLYPVSPGEDLWVALALAGGPTGRGNLSTVRVLTKDQSAQTAVQVNLLETLQRGNKTPYVIKAGDIVFVDTKGKSLWDGFIELLNVSTDAANLVVAIRYLQRNP
jgi:protein involved in polysaccharide export with SLBB domain